MFEIFALGTIWFWLLSVIAFIAVTAFVECGYPGRATWFVIGFFAFIYFLSGLKFIEWIAMNPTDFLIWIVLYFVAGTIYCVFKWYAFLLNERDYFRKHGARDESWRKKEYPPKVSVHRTDLIAWIIYWPFSLLWTLVNDPIRRIATAIYRQIEGLLQAMSNNVFKNDVTLQVKDEQHETKRK